jgi:uncharacterized membrane protein
MSDSQQQAAAPQAAAPQAAAPQAAAPQAAAPQAAAPQAAAPQDIPAIGFLVVAFTDEYAADQALDAMKDAKNQGQFYFEDAAVITQDVEGNVKYHETGDMSVGKGAGIGALVGGVIGILGGPVGVALGAGAGAAVGAALASHDGGFKNENLQTIGVALMPGTSAVAVITSHDFLTAMQQQVPIDEIRTVVSNLAAELSAQLSAYKNVAIGVILTPDGLGIEEIAADEVSAQVVGAVITGDAVAVGAAVETADGTVYEVAGETAEGEAVEEGVVTDEGAVVVDAVVADAVAPADAPKS